MSTHVKANSALRHVHSAAGQLVSFLKQTGRCAPLDLWNCRQLLVQSLYHASHVLLCPPSNCVLHYFMWHHVSAFCAARWQMLTSRQDILQTAALAGCRQEKNLDGRLTSADYELSRIQMFVSRFKNAEYALRGVAS